MWSSPMHPPPCRAHAWVASTHRSPSWLCTKPRHPDLHQTLGSRGRSLGTWHPVKREAEGEFCPLPWTLAQAELYSPEVQGLRTHGKGVADSSELQDTDGSKEGDFPPREGSLAKVQSPSSPDTTRTGRNLAEWQAGPCECQEPTCGVCVCVGRGQRSTIGSISQVSDTLVLVFVLRQVFTIALVGPKLPCRPVWPWIHRLLAPEYWD